jgi:hypothetical protein
MLSSPARLLFLGCGTFAVHALEIAEGDDRYAPAGFINSFEVPARDAQLGRTPARYGQMPRMVPVKPGSPVAQISSNRLTRGPARCGSSTAMSARG